MTWVRSLTSCSSTVIVLLLLVSCHNSKRDNPVDPELTPAVELAVALSDTAGAATLTWTPYSGDQPFASYRVLRRVQGLEAADTLGTIAAAEQTSFVDSTLAENTTYLYQLVVTNSSGFEMSSDAQVALPFNLPAVQIRDIRFESTTAAAAIEWSPYSGPRFRAYQVQRRTAGLEHELVARINDLTATSYTDTALHGSTEYFYRIAVETERDELIPGTEISRSIHPFLTSWPIVMEEGAFVRLYVEEENRLTALVSSSTRVRLLFFDPEGALLEEQVLVEHPLIEIAPASVATTRLRDGQRFLSLASTRPALTVDGVLDEWRSPTDLTSTATVFWPFKTDLLRFDAEGQLVRLHQELFVGSDPFLSETEGEVGTGIQLSLSFEGEARFFNQPNGFLALDNVEVSNSEGDLFNLSFDDDTDIDRESAFARGRTVRGVGVKDGWEIIRDEVPTFHTLHREENAMWRDIRLEADFLAYDHLRLGLQLGVTAVQGPRVVLFLDFAANQAVLELREGTTLVGEFPEPIELREGLIYGVAVEEVDGQVSAWVENPSFWVEQESASWTSLALLETGSGERLVLALDEQPHAIDVEGNQSQVAQPLAAAASEIRIWDLPGSEGTWAGVCFVETNEILVVQPDFFFEGRPQWPADSAVRLGSGLGREPGQFVFPFSFDAGTDGRIYVLDAGNARIQVFDRDGTYITQWGRPGSAAGEFDFVVGGGQNLAGSVAVDGDGFIYVADVFNQRIQKFAP